MLFFCLLIFYFDFFILQRYDAKIELQKFILSLLFIINYLNIIFIIKYLF